MESFLLYLESGMGDKSYKLPSDPYHQIFDFYTINLLFSEPINDEILKYEIDHAQNEIVN